MSRLIQQVAKVEENEHAQSAPRKNPLIKLLILMGDNFGDNFPTTGANISVMSKQTRSNWTHRVAIFCTLKQTPQNERNRRPVL